MLNERIFIEIIRQKHLKWIYILELPQLNFLPIKLQKPFEYPAFLNLFVFILYIPFYTRSPSNIPLLPPSFPV